MIQKRRRIKLIKVQLLVMVNFPLDFMIFLLMVQVDLSLLLHTGLLNMKIDNMNKFSFVMKTKMVKDIPSISLPYYNGETFSK